MTNRPVSTAQQSRLERLKAEQQQTALVIARRRIERVIPLLYREAKVGKLGSIDIDSEGLNLLFWGGVGVGKTHNSMAILIHHAKNGRSIAQVNFRQLLIDVRETYGKGAKSTEKKILEPLLKSDIVLVDDVGADNTEFANRVLYSIIDNRMQHLQRTIVTSNLSIENLEQSIDERIISRLKSYEIIQLSGIDRRAVAV